MATSTKITLKEFNEAEALNGVSLAFSSNGQLSGTISDFVLNFRLYNKGSSTERYSGQVMNKTYYFNSSGVCSDGDPLHNLFIVEAIIEVTSGTIATKGDEGSIINIDILQPRETIALYALQGVLSRIDNPLLLDNVQITLITSLAFKIAQSMINTAADYRAAQSGETPPPSVDVDINNVTSTTDRVLYNMSKSIAGMQSSLSDIKSTLVSQGNKAQKVDISAISATSIPVEVTNASLNTNVTNDSLNTYVTNMPSVPTEPVSITGTVSVDNFPES